MTQVIEQLAEITGFRDRDLVDATLVTALRDLLRPESVAIYRCVGEEADLRWLTRARLTLVDATPSADPLWVAFDSLPRLDAFPARHRALQQQGMVCTAGAAHTVVFPLMTEREVAGVLEIETRAPLDADAQRTVSSILRIYRNFQGLLDYSERDMLTGLLNRKTFDEAFYKLALHFDRAAEDTLPPTERRAPVVHKPHFIGVVDIDHFKQVNDRFGHLIGDEVLLLLSRLMRSCFRYDDRLYRFGGEEFVVLMRCGNDADAGKALERLRSRVIAYPFPQVGEITISVGYTEVRQGDTPSSAFERADKAVYWAKGHGRNQVCSHSALVARGDMADDSQLENDVELF